MTRLKYKVGENMFTSYQDALQNEKDTGLKMETVFEQLPEEYSITEEE